MPLTVNGQIVPEEIIQEEINRVRSDPRWGGANLTDKESLLTDAGEYAAISRVLIEWEAANDPRPLSQTEIEAGINRIRATRTCGDGVEPFVLRAQVERGLKVQRIVTGLTSCAFKPTEAEIENFYTANRDNFRRPGILRAAHIVKNVNANQTEAQAFAAIEIAAAELERGVDFASVADRHSDCKGNGGDLGEFAEGTMVDEFERVIRSLNPGERSGIFATPFGFHIAELRVVKPAGMASFEEVRSDIEKVLMGIREHQSFLDGIEKMRAKATICRVPDSALKENRNVENSSSLLYSE